MAKGIKNGKPKGAGRRAAKAKAADAVDVAVGSLLTGDNLPKLRDLKHHYTHILKLQEQASLAAKAVTTAKKIAKEAGCDVAGLMQIKSNYKLDPMDLAARLRQQMSLMKELGSPVQIQLFETKYGSVEAQAAAEGRADGKAGRSPNGARWADGAPGFDEYTAAWNEGQAELVGGHYSEGIEAAEEE